MSVSKGERIFIPALMAGLALFMIGAFSFPAELRLMPLLFGGLGIGFLTIALFRDRFGIAALTDSSLTEELLTSDAPLDMPSRKNREKTPDASPAGAVKTIAYMLVFWITFVLFGMALTVPIFLAAFLIAEAKVKPHKAVLLALFTIALLLVAMKMMSVRIWAGSIPELMPGYLGGGIMPLL